MKASVTAFRNEVNRAHHQSSAPSPQRNPLRCQRARYALDSSPVAASRKARDRAHWTQPLDAKAKETSIQGVIDTTSVRDPVNIV